MGCCSMWLYRMLCFLFAFLLFQVNSSSISLLSSRPPQSCPSEHSSALIQFKNSLSLVSDSEICRDSYPKTESWNQSIDCCSWEGVTCHSLTGRVIGLDLSCSLLEGNLPSNSSLFLLQDLQWLNLAHLNFIDSQIPSEFSKLRSLTHLNLSYTGFHGSIPSSLGNLTKITFLHLKSNNFEGQIPDVFGNFKKLIMLDFSFNNFHGLFPSSVFNLTGVTDMAFNNNHLGGPLPYNISGLSNLQRLFLSANLLDGRVPGWLFSLPVNLALLDLSSNNLSGNIESCMLSKLRNLQELDLSNNSLLSLSSCSNDVNSTFPKLNILCFSSCNIHQFPSFLRASETLSHLDLSNNKIQGSISKLEAEGLESLTYLDLSFNLLTNVDQFPGKTLQTIDLRSNSLQGPLPTPPHSIHHLLISENELTGEIPSGFCNITFPQVLDMSKNNLSGIIPRCLANYRFLSVLNLRMNNFDGKIPTMCTDEGSWLRSLNLNNNQLEGPIPRSLVNCSELEFLDLGNNNLNDSFPRWLGVLSSLQILVLRSNKFHGPVPNLRSTSFFTSLRVIDISQNEFNGHLPTKFFQNLKGMKDIHEQPAGPYYIGELYYKDSMILTIKGLERTFEKILDIFTTIDFSSNQFEGQVPEVVGELKDLLVLNFSHNSLTGQIPSSLGNLLALESLDLSSNKIEGRIPMQLTNLIFLAVLNLSQNNLVGPIPRGYQFNTFTNDSYIGNLQLCGFPLSKECGESEGTEAPPSIFDEDDDNGRALTWKFAMMGYGCGLVLGLSMGYIVFTAGKPAWLVKIIQRAPNQKVRRQIQKN
ncbi:Receptor like protein 53, putative [Theobroma cacao]|uniref:Receptor like protein 53, putative n=1 Tax=Theobroma cacao TaxID=3641 RepID=A0A061F8A6_THECC|nr:Receptor like protein 53, putative [Theobroma cacao]